MQNKVIRQCEVFQKYTLQMILSHVPEMFNDEGRVDLLVKENSPGTHVVLESDIPISKADMKFDCILTASRY